MLDTTSLRKRLLTSARRRPAALSGRLEELEDRSVPAAVVTVPYQQNNLALPHPGYEGATTTLKAVVRDGVHGYRVTWDTNLDGNFSNDTSADYNVGQLRDVGRTFTVPAGTANSVISVGVRAVDLVTSEVLTGTYRIQVSAITPQFGPRPVPQPGTYPEYWTAAERELVRDVTTDEALWYLHRQLITSGQGTNTIVGSISPSGSLDAPTPLALELFARTGHLPAYPPGTMNAYGGNQPAGNDARWASDPYAETALRLANYLANQLTVFGIDPSAEQNDGRTPIAGTDDGRAYFTPLGTSFGDAGEVGFQSQTLSAFAAVLPVFGGTAVQVGAGVGHTWEYLAQQMVDGLSFAQAKSGTGNGGWYYNPNPYVGAANLESTGDAVRALAAAESGGGGFGVIVNNDTKYRVPNILYSARQANGSVPRFFPTTGGSFTYTASALLGYRWIGAQNFSPTSTLR